jgi:putative hydrolase of the HAD superfamily
MHLVFDADDTLWESNLLFERVIDDFIAWIDHPTLESGAIRSILLDIEAANSTAHGYGAEVFLRSLHDCFEQLLRRPPADDDRARLTELAGPVLAHTIEPIADVDATLDELRGRHDLLLLTKGVEADQHAKIAKSGLADRFRRIVVVPEKNAAVYEDLVRAEDLDPACTWMIGNSLKSDINPALAAGLGAVFIPNENTWTLEHAELDGPASRLIRIERFRDLLRHF